MKLNMKDHIYEVSNLIIWISLSVIAVVLIIRFVPGLILPTVLSIAAVIGLAFFCERNLCRAVGRIIAFLLHDEI